MSTVYKFLYIFQFHTRKVMLQCTTLVLLLFITTCCYYYYQFLEVQVCVCIILLYMCSCPCCQVFLRLGLFIHVFHNCFYPNHCGLAFHGAVPDPLVGSQLANSECPFLISSLSSSASDDSSFPFRYHHPFWGLMSSLGFSSLSLASPQLLFSCCALDI